MKQLAARRSSNENLWNCPIPDGDVVTGGEQAASQRFSEVADAEESDLLGRRHDAGLKFGDVGRGRRRGR